MDNHGKPRPGVTQPRTEKQRLKEEQKIREYQQLVNLINTRTKSTKDLSSQEATELLELTTKLLTRNPEYYTIWNVRRRLLIHGFFSRHSDSSSPSTVSQSGGPPVTTLDSSAESSSTSPTNAQESTQSTTSDSPNSQSHGKSGTILDLIQADLQFIFPLMIEFPKCYWIWKYRLWLLEQTNQRLDASVASGLWNRELELVGKMLARDNRNFHGWGYRRRVVSELESHKLNGSSMVETEFAYTTKMVRASLSNFSAWHNRSKLIPRFLEERGAKADERRKFLDDEFELVTEAIFTDAYPYAQSAWFYYQFLMTTLTNDKASTTITPNFTLEERCTYITRQLDNLRDILDGAEDCKWAYSALIEYTTALCVMEKRTLRDDEESDCRAWLEELKELDPFRRSKWSDLEAALDRLAS